jgi:hypothetical protein
MAPATFDEFKALFEQSAEFSTDLPTPVKGDNGPRFANVDALVEHVPGVVLEAAPRAKAKRSAPPLASATPLPLDPEAVARLVAFVLEREAIRLRKEAGQPPPWTDDPILTVGAFCNVHRERDRVTRWITANWRDPHREDPDLWFAMATARCVNEPDALAELGYPVPFDAERIRSVLTARQLRGDKVFRSDAYKPPTPPEKNRSTIDFLVSDVLGPLWRDREVLRPQANETLATYSDRLRERYRIGPFLAGQVVADLKGVGPLFDASDYWTFAVPGPGSERGLNRVCGRPVKASWSEPVWHATLLQLGAEIAPRLEAAGIARLEAQNLQNVLCEFDKYARADEKGGKPSRKYKPTAAPLPQPDVGPPKSAEIAIADHPPTIPSPPAAPEPDEIPAYILEDAPAATAAKPKASRKASPQPESEPSKSEAAAGPQPESEARVPPGNGSGRSAGRHAYPHGERATGTPVAFYIYRDARERNYLGVKRTSTKQFPQYHWTGQQWCKGLPKGFLKIPYRLPELLDAPSEAWVVIAAGEKDAETAAALGFVATTNSGGEGKGQWTPELNRWFTGKQRVAIMEDNDATGYAHAIEVANALRGIVPDIRIVGFRELNKGGDLTDWMAADRKRGTAELKARIEAAPAPTSYELIRASAVPRRAVEWPWPGHLARGELEILTGVPDIGKSQIHNSYAAHMTTGRAWPNGAKGPPVCDVIMLTAEDNTAHTVCPRLAAAGANLDRIHILNKICKDNRNRMFLLQEDLDVLEHILTNNPAIGLVTIDPITAYMGGKLDSHRATDVRNQLGPLKELAERSNVVFSAITHPAKRPGAKALDHYIGSQAFIAAPRIGHICIWEMEEDANGQPQPTGRALFATAKHNIYTAMPTLAYRLVAVDGGVDAETGAPITISRVEWAEEMALTADQALAAAVAGGKAPSGVVVFVLDMLANGPVAKKVIEERAAARGFSRDQLKRAKEKANIVAFKQPGAMAGGWFWALAQHRPTDQQQQENDKR